MNDNREEDFICLAIRSGDYYMFDDESDQEIDEGKQDEATLAQEQVNRYQEIQGMMDVLFI